MIKPLATMLMGAALSTLCLGCLGRLFSEGMGSATGASGKVGGSGTSRDLTKYKGLSIEPITVSAGVQAPPEMADMIRTDLTAAAEKRGLRRDGASKLTLSGEIVHHETSSTVDTAVGPFEEVIVRVRLADAESGNVAETNLTGRSKATSSSGTKHLSAGVAKALDEWLKDGGLRKAGEKDNG